MSEFQSGLPKKVLLELLTLNYIRGKSANSAAEYVTLYREALEEISQAYRQTEKPFNIKPLCE